MPNGGVPIHMVVHPLDGSPVVLYLNAGVLRLFERRVWEADGAAGKPLAVLDQRESAAIAWFLRYWLGESALRPGYEMGKDVNMEFEF